MGSFKKAEKKQLKLRMALMGPSGSGKSYTALQVAKTLAGDGEIAAIDTEHSTLSKYSDLADFDVCELESFHPDKYVEAIKEAAEGGYSVLIIDSLSHAWSGKDGLLEEVDKIGKRKNLGNSFAAWKDANPILSRLIEAILSFPGHVIVTLRTKTEYVVEQNERGKSVPRKVGLAPVFKEGLEYEMDVAVEMDLDNNMIVSKSRCPKLAGQVINKPGKEVAETLRAWLSDGIAATPKPEVPAAPPIDRDAVMSEIGDLIKRLGWTPTQGKEHLKQTYGKTSRQLLNDAELTDFCSYLTSLAIAEPAPEQEPVAARQG